MKLQKSVLVSLLGELSPLSFWEREKKKRGGYEVVVMEGSAEEELERRSKFLSSLIQKKKATQQEEDHDRLNVRVRASDMSLSLQNRAFLCARDHLDSMSAGKLDSKRLALALKKVILSTFFTCLLQLLNPNCHICFFFFGLVWFGEMGITFNCIVELD